MRSSGFRLSVGCSSSSRPHETFCFPHPKLDAPEARLEIRLVESEVEILVLADLGEIEPRVAAVGIADLAVEAHPPRDDESKPPPMVGLEVEIERARRSLARRVGVEAEDVPRGQGATGFRLPAISCPQQRRGARVRRSEAEREGEDRDHRERPQAAEREGGRVGVATVTAHA